MDEFFSALWLQWPVMKNKEFSIKIWFIKTSQNMLETDVTVGQILIYEKLNEHKCDKWTCRCVKFNSTFNTERMLHQAEQAVIWHSVYTF